MGTLLGLSDCPSRKGESPLYGGFISLIHHTILIAAFQERYNYFYAGYR